MREENTWRALERVKSAAVQPHLCAGVQWVRGCVLCVHPIKLQTAALASRRRGTSTIHLHFKRAKLWRTMALDVGVCSPHYALQLWRCNYKDDEGNAEKSSSIASELQAALQLQHRCTAAVSTSRAKSMLTTPRNRKRLKPHWDSKMVTPLQVSFIFRTNIYSIFILNGWLKGYKVCILT